MPGYETYYAVSSLGRVKSFDRDSRHSRGGIQRRQGKVLKNRPDGRGYVTVSLCVDDVRKSVHIHQLVAKAFHGPAPFKSAPVNHIDFNTVNNRADNLEWSNAKANIQHPHRARHFCPVANPNHRRKLTPEQVLEIRQLRAGGMTQWQIAAKFGVSRSYISMLAARLKWVNLAG